VHTTLKEDVYLSMMSIDAAGRLGLRAFLEPLVVWLWIGTAIIVLGAALAMWPRRSLAAGAARPSKPATAAGPAPDEMEPAA
jgi:cytochrome c-type biogenesis protein CcmF